MPTLTTVQLQHMDCDHHLHPFTDFKQYRAQNGGRIVSHAEHIYIYDSQGKQILDGMSGLWCCNLGYSQNTIIEAVNTQMHQLPYYNNFFNCSNQPAVEMAAALADISPRGFNQVFFTNSGSEANDTNIRLVHRYFDLLDKPDKKMFISRKNAYHGSTIAASSLGGMSFMHNQHRGLNFVHHIDQPHWFAEGGDLDRDAFGLHVAQQLEQKIDQLGETNVAAFIAEPIQGAGGVIVPPETYWPEIQRICNERDILLISDEVICGFGRTGHWFGCDTFGYKPDLITFAKAVTNGYQPLGGVIVGEKIANVLNNYGGQFCHGLTYSGHPASCAAGLATLSIMKQHNIVQNTAQNIAPYLQQQLRQFEDHPCVGEVRGTGMLAAIELVKDKQSREKIADHSAAAAFCRDQAIANGLMVRAVGDAIVTAPPMICDKSEINLLVERLGHALDATAKKYSIK